MDPVTNHFGNWVGVVLWIVVFGLFLLFTPFYKKSQRKPSSVYMAFVIALALEMFGVPLSMYVITWGLGRSLPDGVLWGHTLISQIGHLGMYISYVFYLLGILLIVLGWREIYKRYWSKEEGKGELVTNGIYGYIRHPQYTGFMLITLGMIFEWATLPLLIMWPLLTVIYYRLAKKEESDMQVEFGRKYQEYRRTTGMFLPRLWTGRQAKQARASR
ncbi:MAG TPA: isoprenylcysteine carboxylmethyltransferase family protein [Anaerolineales bacterium]